MQEVTKFLGVDTYMRQSDKDFCKRLNGKYGVDSPQEEKFLRDRGYIPKDTFKDYPEEKDDEVRELPCCY